MIEELIEALEDVIGDFEFYLAQSMDEPNRESIEEAKAVLLKAREETP